MNEAEEFLERIDDEVKGSLADDAVKSWYSNAFCPSSIACKLKDWRTLGFDLGRQPGSTVVQAVIDEAIGPIAAAAPLHRRPAPSMHQAFEVLRTRYDEDLRRVWPEHLIINDAEAEVIARARHKLRGCNVLNMGPCFPVDEIMLQEHVATWVGIDFTASVIQRCLEFEGLCAGFVQGDFRDMPFESSRFHVVLDFSSVDHVFDGAPIARREAYRVLRSGGIHVVTYANRMHRPPGHPREVFGDYGFERWMTPEEMVHHVEAAGFSVVYHDDSWVRSGLVAIKP